MKIYPDASRRTEFIGQSEAAECGIAYLAMVSSYHGLKTVFPVSTYGTELRL